MKTCVQSDSNGIEISYSFYHISISIIIKPQKPMVALCFFLSRCSCVRGMHRIFHYLHFYIECCVCVYLFFLSIASLISCQSYFVYTTFLTARCRGLCVISLIYEHWVMISIVMRKTSNWATETRRERQQKNMQQWKNIETYNK